MRLTGLFKVAAAIVIVIVLVAVVGAGVFLATFDANEYRATVEQQVKAATGRDLRLEGPVRAHVFTLTPAVSARKVRFANAAWGRRPDMARVDRVSVEIAILPLLTGTIQVEGVVLEGADILLERNKAGTGNWVMDTGKAAPADRKAASKGGTGALPRVRDVTLRDVTLAWRDAVTGRHMDVRVDRLRVRTADWRSDVEISLDAAYNDTPVTLEGTVGPLARVTDDAPWALDLVLQAADAEVTVAGSIEQPMQARGLDLEVDGAGDSIARVARLAPGVTPPAGVKALGPFDMAAAVTGGLDEAVAVRDLKARVGRDAGFTASVTGEVANVLAPSGVRLKVAADGRIPEKLGAPGLPPVDVTARVRDKQPRTWLLRDFRFTAGKSDLSGEGDLKLAGKRPSVRLVLDSQHLDLRALMPAGRGKAAKAQSDGKKGDDKRVIPDMPLPMAALRAADAHAEITVKTLLTPTVRAEDVRLTADLADGTLRLKPAATLGGGPLQATLRVTPKGGKEAARVRLRARGEKMALGRLLREVKATEQLTGAATKVDVRLAGQGGTVRALAGDLDGHINVDVGAGRIDNELIDLAAGDIGQSLSQRLNPLTESRDYTALKCVAVRLTAKKGVVSGDPGLGVETERITVLGDGAVNLKTEAIDAAIRPDAKEGLGVSLGDLSGLVRLRGTLGAPRVALDPGGAMKAAATAGAAVATGGASLLGQVLMDKAAANDDPCGTVRGTATQGKKKRTKSDKKKDRKKTSPGDAMKKMGEDMKKLFGQ